SEHFFAHKGRNTPCCVAELASIVRIFAAAKTLIFLGSVLHNYRQRDHARQWSALFKRPSRTWGENKDSPGLGHGTNYSVVATIRAEAIRVRITAAPTGAKGSASCYPPGSGPSHEHSCCRAP